MKLIVMILVTSLCIKNITGRKLNSQNHNENNSKTDRRTDNENSVKANDIAENDKTSEKAETEENDIMNEKADNICFYYEELSEELKSYITGKSYKENDDISYDDLRHVVVGYIDFEGRKCIGELIVNASIAKDVTEIFKELYDNQYQIEKIKLIDEYDADDDKSMADNNSSAFNYRVVDGTNRISAHGYGLAIDINPLYNPYVRTTFGERNVLPVNAVGYADRTKEFDHKIVKGDICYNIFIRHGFNWGGDWNTPVDYQHFYKELER